jgi:hypothetical protein
MTNCKNYLRSLKRLWLIDENPVDFARKDVANRPDDHVAFLVDVARSRGLLDPADDHLPETHQVRQVARQFLLRPVGAGRAHDEPEPFWRIELAKNVAQPAAGVVVFDLARHADASQRRHQHQVPARDTDVGRQRRPLRADSFLNDLHQNLVAAAEDLLDRRLDPRSNARTHPLLRGPTPGRRGSAGGAAVVADLFQVGIIIIILVVAEIVVARFWLLAPRRAVRHDLHIGIVPPLAVVLRLDVADVQKPVATHAEVDERGLDARLQVDDLAFVNVADVVVLATPLDVQLFQNSVFADGNPALFRLRDVNQHLLLHGNSFLG